jgi:aminopeptidase N
MRTAANRTALPTARLAAPYTFVMTEASETLSFSRLDAEPVPSILRGFSAPVVLEFDYSDAQLLALLANDSDPFNRWEAGQRLAVRSAIKAIAAVADPAPLQPLNDAYLEAMRSVLRHPRPGRRLQGTGAHPALGNLHRRTARRGRPAAHPRRARGHARPTRRGAGRRLAQWAFETNTDNGAYQPDPLSSGRRALAGMALTQLCLAARATGDAVWPGKALQRFKDAGNMTDRFNALAALVSSGHPLAAQALPRFHAMFKDEALVLDKWFALQAGAPTAAATSCRPCATDETCRLQPAQPEPRAQRDLQLLQRQPGAFHRPDAAGYVFWSDRVIELDGINPQVAARLARALDRWKKLTEPYRSAAREALVRVAAKPDLSNDVREVVTRARLG